MTFCHINMNDLSFEIYQLLELDQPINKYLILVINEEGRISHYHYDELDHEKLKDFVIIASFGSSHKTKNNSVAALNGISFNNLCRNQQAATFKAFHLPQVSHGSLPGQEWLRRNWWSVGNIPPSNRCNWRCKLNLSTLEYFYNKRRVWVKVSTLWLTNRDNLEIAQILKVSPAEEPQLWIISFRNSHDIKHFMLKPSNHTF